MSINLIANRTGVSESKVRKVIELLNDGATIPFIARYRKEATGSLDEVQISRINTENQRILDIISRKKTILKAIIDSDSLNEELQRKIGSCWDEKELEDLYLPFKKKAKTKATVARENGLEGLAKIIMSQGSSNVYDQAKKFVRNEITSVEQAIEGAQHIIAEWVNENIKVRDIVRFSFNKFGRIYAKKIKDASDQYGKFKDYYDYEGPITKLPAHRLHAILRGEKEKILKVKVDIDENEIQDRIFRFYIRNDSTGLIKEAILDALKRLLLPSLRNEILKDAKSKADEEAIKIFSRNAKDLLLSPPLGAKRVLGIDPGFRTGCKIVCLNEFGDLLANRTIYPHPPQKNHQQSEEAIKSLISHYRIEAIAIGNGTAGKETFNWLRRFLNSSEIEIFLVNEDGASIYSASEIARDEFPDLDLTVRGAISIARRLMDPLAELVKIDPKSIGVGQYQHDVNQKRLKEELSETVFSCVNQVGVNLNTASSHLLSYVSGIGPSLAKNITQFREENGKIKDISQLMKVPKFGKKAFEQSAGFLRIKEGINKLDDTGVHPESYSLVRKMLKDLGLELEEILANEEALDKIIMENYVTDKVGLPTLKDIITELKKPGLDPREKAKAVEFQKGLESIEDLEIGQVISGVVTNITKFGAFLDIGIKDSALLHISQIRDQYISDPADELSINQQVKVKVIEVDIERKRISVSMKAVNH